MPNWKQVLEEIQNTGSAHDVVRRKYLAQLNKLTDRNVIVYYSAWLEKGAFLRNVQSILSVNDSDKNGLMAAIYKLDKSKGLDLILHTPGGDLSATESIVDYLRSIFGTNIRAIVPQIAMSAGTMIALSCSKIVLGKHSNLGPIDPQIGGIPAHGVIEEFKQAKLEVMENPATAMIWQPIIAKYSPTLVGQCVKAIEWSETMVKEWLKTGMFDGDTDAQAKADSIVQELGSHALTKSHGRHISIDRAKSLGIKVITLEDDNEFQDAVLAVHHACIHTLAHTPAVKIIENHIGAAFIPGLQQALQASPQSGQAPMSDQTLGEPWR
jgi:ATP-dependent protease ClpP protease subunit